MAPKLVVCLLAVLLPGVSALAQETEVWQPGEGRTAALLSPAELQKLAAPIALYPDSVLSNLLPAATLPDQISRASSLLAGGDTGQIDSSDLDETVKALTKLPSVLQKLADQIDWTTRLGQAVVAQQQDLLAAIQTLRKKAQDAGNLKSTPEQTVAVQDESIVIEPAQPEVIYIPQYDPVAIYEPAYEGAAVGLSFLAGAAVGRWYHNPFYWGAGYLPWRGWTHYGPVWAGRGWGYPSVNPLNGRIAQINRVNNIDVNRNNLLRAGQIQNTARASTLPALRAEHAAAVRQDLGARTSTAELRRNVTAGLQGRGGEFGQRSEFVGQNRGLGADQWSAYASNRGLSGGARSERSLNHGGALGSYGSRELTQSFSNRGAASRSRATPFSGGGGRGGRRR
jgi:hypothetical protein